MTYRPLTSLYAGYSYSSLPRLSLRDDQSYAGVLYKLGTPQALQLVSSFHLLSLVDVMIAGLFVRIFEGSTTKTCKAIFLFFS